MVVGLSVLAVAASRAATEQDYDWEKGEREIKRVAPSSFKQLPATVIKELEDQGCTIPQSDYPDFSNELHNVIQGEFARKGQRDWAVLCSREGKSSILVFWEKPSECPDNIGEVKDKIFLQGWLEGQVIYSRVIAGVSADYVLKHYERGAGTEPPPFDHEGINDLFAGKASVIHYCERGKWIGLTGLD